MPYINLSRLVRGPALADKFDVNRRTETVDPLTGRSSTTPTLYSGVLGVVTAASPNDLDRLDDSQRMGRHLSIVTDFGLIGPAPGKQPDTIVWYGDTFIVKSLDPYPQFGPGFVQAIVGSTDVIDQPTL